MDHKNYLDVQIKMTKENLEEMKKKYIADAHRSRMNDAIKVFKEFCDKTKPVLDVGCRDGGFLNEMKKNGFSGTLEGIECCVEAVNEANKIDGITVWEGDVHKLTMYLPSKYYGTVVLSHVLEHTVDPKRVLNNIYEVMETGGILFIEVPIEPKPEKVPTPWAHYYTFQSEDQLDVLMEGINFELVRIVKDERKNKWLRTVWMKNYSWEEPSKILADCIDG